MLVGKHKMSTSDRKEFDLYLKFFVLKSIQIIVQSRKGERLRTKSTSASTWFSLALPEDRAVVSELKKASTSRVPQPGSPHCVEISLKSTESSGDDSSMVIEVWTMSINPSATDPSAKATSVVYPRMSVALKSLLALTRVLPAHRLSRQLDEDWTLCYRILHGSPEGVDLGPGATSASVAHVSTPYGRLSIHVAYRKSIDLLQSSSNGDGSFVMGHRQDTRSSEGKASHLSSAPMLWPQSKVAPFTNLPVYNEDEATSLPVQDFAHLMGYQKMTSLTPSLGTQASSGSNQGDLSDTSSTPQSRQLQAQDDFVMLDQAVKPIFAPEPPASDDLSQFFEECRNPPNLDMFSSGNVMDINAALMEDVST